MKTLLKLKGSLSRMALLVGVLLLLCFESNGYSANHPLEVINIRPAETGSPAISASNRIFRAYPEIEYNIRPAVIGGLYPYNFLLSNAPGGMSIDSATGEISWPNPSVGSYGPITLSVTDSENTTITTSWSITVSASGFLFVDSSYSGTERGTIDQPYNSIQDILDLNSTHANDIVYFRTGTYHVPIFHNYYSGDTHGCNLSYDDGRPCMWIGYPGETAIIDMDDNYLDTHLTTVNYYFDNLEFTNMTNWGIRSLSSNNYYTIRRCDFNNILNTATTNRNQGFIYLTAGTIGNYLVLQDSDWHNYTGTAGIGSLYRCNKMLIEDCELYDQYSGSDMGICTALALKADITNSTVRGNKIIINEGSVLGTGLNGCFNGCYNLEICFNFFKSSGEVHRFNVHGGTDDAWVQGLTYYYRNTCIGNFIFQYLDGTNRSGPFILSNNVIINENNTGYTNIDHIAYHYTCSGDYEQDVMQNDNLKGYSADNIVDVDGKLQGTYSTQFLGTRGWEIGSDTPPPPPNPPSEATNFQIINQG